MPRILWEVSAILLLFWLIGFSLDLAGGFLHMLLIVALSAVIAGIISYKW